MRSDDDCSDAKGCRPEWIEAYRHFDGDGRHSGEGQNGKESHVDPQRVSVHQVFVIFQSVVGRVLRETISRTECSRLWPRCNIQNGENSVEGGLGDNIDH